MKSKQRVRDIGEVFTGTEEVSAMLDLVGDDASDPKKRILEPAAGNGNFLVLILERRLQYISSQAYKKKSDYERNVIIALANMYGIDIMEDNVIECRQRLLSTVQSHYSLARNTDYPSPTFERNIREILSTNIIVGDTLNAKQKINFIEYKISHRGIVERQQFNLSQLAKGDTKPAKVFEASDIRNLSAVSPQHFFYYNGDQMPIFTIPQNTTA